MYILHKLFAYIVGSFLLMLPAPILKRLVGGGEGFVRGVTAPNKSGDHSQIYDFGANFIRVNDDNKSAIKDFADLAVMWGYRYFVLVGQWENSDEDNAKTIASIDDVLVGTKKPVFYALVNEVNEESKYSNIRVKNTDTLLRANYGKNLIVTRGAHTGINESAAKKVYFEYFNGTRELLKDKPHLLHFYLKPGKGLAVKFENLLRKATLVYTLFRLNLKGIPAKTVIIDEAHNADTKKELIVTKNELQPYSINNGKPNGDLIIDKLSNDKFKVIRYHGDFVFATKEGWEELEKLVDKLGIPVIMYYMAPYLYYKGNTVLKGEQ